LTELTKELNQGIEHHFPEADFSLLISVDERIGDVAPNDESAPELRFHLPRSSNLPLS
jgi:hypothetical protein